MRILIAPDSFKESLSALEAAQCIKNGFEKIFPEAVYELLPIGDGGEGTVAALSANMRLTYADKEVTGPFGERKQIAYTTDGHTALVEMAALVGLEDIPREKRDPLRLSTKGLGELICLLAEEGVKQLFIGVGGSGTNDGGIGMAEGLGYIFFDAAGNRLEAVGENLGKVASFQKPSCLEQLKQMDITVITDVTNPLCGENGAVYVFGPQKGLEEAELAAADEDLRNFYSLIAPKIIDKPGSGAGGGMGAGLATFAQGAIVSGIDYVLDLLDFDKRVRKANLVIVGEGRMDGQSMEGKAPVGIARRVPTEIPVVAICGSTGAGSEQAVEHGIDAVFSTVHEVADLQKVLAEAAVNLERTAENVAALIKVSGKLSD
ncbi:glycerate kinase [Enterococcus sp. BWR-S5]|uniref:glycerate kinase n=1 Tax=Enterococcus sp. BWR-S5 TaxID=2787714 RepID=UPI001924C4FD|nr:glycerate kinase [Enterococcus sp. BWR-S5]MBL1224364.1 glycerate kinase [Enterococcus sp. BWR-S5]